MDTQFLYMCVLFSIVFSFMFFIPPFFPEAMRPMVAMFGLPILFIGMFGIDIIYFYMIAKYTHMRMAIGLNNGSTRIMHILFKTYVSVCVGFNQYITVFNLSKPMKFPNFKEKSPRFSIFHEWPMTARFKFVSGQAQYNGMLINHPHSEKTCVVDELDEGSLEVDEGNPIPNYTLHRAGNDHDLIQALRRKTGKLAIGTEVFTVNEILAVSGHFKRLYLQNKQANEQGKEEIAQYETTNRALLGAVGDSQTQSDDITHSIATLQGGIMNADKKRHKKEKFDLKWLIILGIVGIILVYAQVNGQALTVAMKQFNVWIKDPRNLIVTLVVVSSIAVILYLVLKNKIWKSAGGK